LRRRNANPDENGSDGPSAAEIGIAPLARLSHTEYKNTLSDLFPGVTLQTLTLVADPDPNGYDNDANAMLPSPELTFAYHQNAQTVAAAAIGSVLAKIGCAEDAKCFVTNFGRKVFRRPLDDGEISAFTGPFTGKPFAVGAQLALQAMLEAPQFLYHVESHDPSAPPDSYAVASRLSYFLWNSMPDDAAFDLAAGGKLVDDLGVKNEIDRMLADPKSERSIVHFFRQWYALKRLDAGVKTDEFGFTDGVKSAMHEEADRFLRDAVYKRNLTLREMLTARTTFVNADLAPIYGVPAPATGQWQEVELPPERAGLLTRAGFLADAAHESFGSPVWRGIFVLRNLACAPPGPPPLAAQGVEVTHAPAGTVLTNRQAYEATTSSRAECAACHKSINGIGYVFEAFDAVGRYRTQDHGQPVDTSGSLFGKPVANATELANSLADSPNVTHCMALQMARYAFRNGAEGTSDTTVKRLEDQLQNSGWRDWIASVANDPSFLKAPLEPKDAQ
jgi:hypothetical protein